MKTICIDNKVKLHIDFDHTFEEWEEKYGLDETRKYNGESHWDFSFEDILGGAIEVDERMVYWCVDGRVCETDIYLTDGVSGAISREELEKELEDLELEKEGLEIDDKCWNPRYDVVCEEIESIKKELGKEEY